MNNFILLMTFVLQLQWINSNANTTSKLGISPCMFSGIMNDGKYCTMPPMNFSSLPSKCTSFVFDILHFVNDYTNASSFDIFNTLSLSQSLKPLYLYIGYDDQESWINATRIANITAAKVSELKHNLSDSNITGLILKNLNCDPKSNVHFDKQFYDNFKQYVTILKTSSVYSEIGLYVNATSMMYYSNNPNASGWFNFADWMNDLMDYYIIGFDKFNPCNDQFKSGIVPINDSNVHTNNTLTAFANVLKNSNIAKDKIYLELLISPTINDTTTEILPACAVSYKKYCERDDYNLYWCADKADAFFQKGKFARDIKAKGIVAKYIDLSDPTGNCGCRDEFITYSMIMRGFLNLAPITYCEKLN